MGKRCLDINCPNLARDGSCLLNEEERKYLCLAKETVKYEDKDVWMDEVETE